MTTNQLSLCIYTPWCVGADVIKHSPLVCDVSCPIMEKVLIFTTIKVQKTVTDSIKRKMYKRNGRWIDLLCSLSISEVYVRHMKIGVPQAKSMSQSP